MKISSIQGSDMRRQQERKLSSGASAKRKEAWPDTEVRTLKHSDAEKVKHSATEKVKHSATEKVKHSSATTDRRKSSYGSTVAVSSASFNDEATPTQRKMSADAIASKAPSVCCCSVQ
jgi:hypothetical protein